jgi:hypothetical protein
MTTNSRIQQTINNQNIDILTGGSGDPLFIVHHDIGNPGWLPFYDLLAEKYRIVRRGCAVLGIWRQYINGCCGK